MLLSGSVKLKCGLLEYSFNPTNRTHSVGITKGCTSGYHVNIYKTPGEAINALVPYRDDYREVADLISWLSDSRKWPGR